MSITYLNPSDERAEVRLNCGNTGETNLHEADIDKSLSMANEETTERTGLLPSDTKHAGMRRKMKVLLASSYLMIRFSNLIEVRANILKEIDGMTEQMKTLEDTGADDDESLIEGDEDDYAAMQQVNFWTKGTRRSVVAQGRLKSVYGYADDYIIARVGIF